MIIIRIWVLAINVWREMFHDRVMHILAASGVILMFSSLVFGELAAGGKARIVQNMSFWVIGIWGLITVIYIGSNIIRQEFQHKTVYLILSRPVSRPVFLFGKFFGMLSVLWTVYMLLVIAWLILMKFEALPFTAQHFIALTFIWGEWMLLAGFSLAFASFTSPLLHNFFLVSVSFLGHWSSDLRIFAANTPELWLKKSLEIIYFLLPNLEALNFRQDAIYSKAIGWDLVAEGLILFAGYVAAALLVANIFFLQRKLR